MRASTIGMLLGPFTEIVTLDDLPAHGPIKDHQLRIIKDGGIVIKNGLIHALGSYADLKSTYPGQQMFEQPATALPAFVDSHTHICYAGTRAKDYAMRLSGKSYQEIAASGGGILDTVTATRNASFEDLFQLTQARMQKLIRSGVATCEVKSGYGLDVENEIKLLQVLKKLASSTSLQLVPTCLAAHCRPPEFSSNQTYLDLISSHIFPQLQQLNLTCRIDIFVEKSAFSIQEARSYLNKAKAAGFSICLHADQFTRGGAQLAAEVEALSADHLEVSKEEDFISLRQANVIPIVLPGASLGLGMPFAKARQMLDFGLPLAIASDWNPGSAPFGNLLTEAAFLGAAERLTMAETLAAITQRAARALSLHDRGILKEGMRADIVIFPCADYREILYHQGALEPIATMIGGQYAALK